MMILKKYVLDLSRETLFEAWVSPDMTIPPVTKIESNPVLRGVFKLWAESPEAVGIMTGIFEDVICNEKLKYTWQWEGSEEESLVSVEFEQDGNQTTIHLEHSGFLSQESKDAHDVGWDSYVDGLVAKIKLDIK
ncbi:SRPBCC family protein [Reichenbachiella sp.]|uniref:SRPBCC family protein n=1 Tax=Reichenbachiella sp. TaxID=2184521 RepID=UPI00329759C6